MGKGVSSNVTKAWRRRDDWGRGWPEPNVASIWNNLCEKRCNKHTFFKLRGSKYPVNRDVFYRWLILYTKPVVCQTSTSSIRQVFILSAFPKNINLSTYRFQGKILNFFTWFIISQKDNCPKQAVRVVGIPTFFSLGSHRSTAHRSNRARENRI